MPIRFFWYKCHKNDAECFGGRFGVPIYYLTIKIIYMPKYSKKAGEKVERAMHEKKRGKLKSGRSGKKVTSRKQAIAIGLSEARKEGAKVPKKKTASKKKSPAKKKTAKKTGRKKTARKKSRS
jgi:hypothetical protein